MPRLVTTLHFLQGWQYGQRLGQTPQQRASKRKTRQFQQAPPPLRPQCKPIQALALEPGQAPGLLLQQLGPHPIHQAPVGNLIRADLFTLPASQALIQMLLQTCGRLQLLLQHAAHQGDATARGICFVLQHLIAGALRHTQTTGDTVIGNRQQFRVTDLGHGADGRYRNNILLPARRCGKTHYRSCALVV